MHLGSLPLDDPAAPALRPFAWLPRPWSGFRVKSDLDYAHWSEAGIGTFVPSARKNETTPFLGKSAPSPTELGELSSARSAAIFAVETSAEHAWSVPGDSPVVSAAGDVVGFSTTSARQTRRRVGWACEWQRRSHAMSRQMSR